MADDAASVDALTSAQMAEMAAKAAASSAAPPAADVPGAPSGAAPSDGALTSAQMADMAAKAGPGGPKQHYLAGLARSMLGQGALLGWGDEAMAQLRSLAYGEDYASALKDERAKLKQFRKENPRTAPTAEIAGGFLTPGFGLLTGALKPAASTLGRMAQGGMIGSGIGAVAGAGAADEGEGRLSGAKGGAGLGLLVGGALPLGGSLVSAGVDKAADVLGPTLARFGAANRVPGVKSTSAEAAADAVMIQEMKAAGETPAAYAKRFADVDRDRTFHGGVGAGNASEAVSPAMLLDASPVMTRLAGSAVRASPEVGARAEAVLGARQTGVPPLSDTGKGYAAEAGLATRNPLSVKPDAVVLDAPAGQQERLRGGLQKAYNLADTDFHGLETNAYETEKSLLSALGKKATVLYDDFRAAQTGFDVRPVIMPAIDKWTTKLADSQLDEGNIIRKGLRAFTTDGAEWVRSADQVDRAKRALDSAIDKASSALKPDKNKARILSEMREDFVNAVDNIKANGIGDKWQAARSYFSTEKKRQEALQWGRDALKADSNASKDEFAAFPADLKKLARFGILEGIENAGAGKRRVNDLTGVFETNRVQDLLRETIPRAGGSGPYSVQPERFGNYVNTEKSFVLNSNKVLGNSATAGRLADDERLTRQTLSTMFDRFKSGNIGVVPLALEAVSAGLTKFFGFREDVAQELGRRLFTAKPAERDRILQRLEAQWGSDKVGALTRFIGSATTAAAGAIPAAGGRAIGESQPRLEARRQRVAP